MEIVPTKVSPRKIEANRRNALRSTGPRTPEGKSVVRWNALKHGLLAKEVVIQAGEGKESEVDFKSLLAQLREDLQPVGVLEEMLVEKIAVCYWRLRRVLRCEIGEIRKELDTVGGQELLNRARQVRLARKLVSLDSDEARQSLANSSMGIEYLIAVLDGVRHEVEETGSLSDESKKKLIWNFGGDENGFAHWCLTFDLMAAEGSEKAGGLAKNGGSLSPERCKRMMLDLLDKEKEKLKDLMEIIQQNEALVLEAKRSSLSLPSKEAVDKILRYETTIERQLYRAVSQLERLQRQRKGEVVPPPISIEVSSGN